MKTFSVEQKPDERAKFKKKTDLRKTIDIVKIILSFNALHQQSRRYWFSKSKSILKI